MTKTPIAIIGVGKIARDQHLPTIAASEDFQLRAAVAHHAADLDVPTFPTIAAMMAAVPEIRAVSICTPPTGRLELVQEAIAHDLDVMLEKPPAGTLGEAEQFAVLAVMAGRSLFMTWHSRHAAGVEPAREWLATRRIRHVTINWLEDVRVWHPGQEWIWNPGVGVFDPGINALSILTRIMPEPVLLNASTLSFPEGRAAPIGAMLALRSGDVPIDATFSFDQRGPQTWSIDVDTADGELQLLDGGSRLNIARAEVPLDDRTEYQRLYTRFAELLAKRSGEADLAPFRLVADAFLLGQREVVGSFNWD